MESGKAKNEKRKDRMSSTIQEKDDLFMRHIEAAVKSAVNEAAEEQVEAVKAAIEKKVYAQVDKITLNLLANYDVSNDRNQLVIKVSKGDLK